MAKNKNPKTIMADRIYDGLDIDALSEYNLYPIIVKTKNHVNSNLFKTYYHNFTNIDNDSYCFLDIFHFLGKTGGGTNIILSGSDLRKINYSKLIINTSLELEDSNDISTDLILYTDKGKLLLTDILSDLMEEELRNNHDKVYKINK